jgi:hypothetical protein
MSTWTKADIQKKIRQVTGRLSENEMSNTELSDRLNKYYQYTFPAEVKLDRNHTYYEFLTVPNQAYYTAPDMYTNFEPTALIDMMPLTWFQDPVQFFSVNPMPVTLSNPWTGDGITNSFTTTITSYSIFPGTLVVTDNLEVFQDTNKTWTTADVNLVGSLGGSATVNYETGVVSVAFFSAPNSGQLINLSYTAFQPGRPRAVLYYNNEFQFANVPDTAYRFRVKAYTKLDPLVNSTDRPLLDQWGECLAYGTARCICSDYGETDAYAEITMLYKEQVAYVMNRTSQNLLNQRSLPSF